MTYSSISAEDLIKACVKSTDPEAWEEFISRFHRLISVVVLRTARHWGKTSESILEDLIQDTYVKFCADGCRLLRNFHFQHPEAIFGYIKVVATNVVRDHYKAVHAEKRRTDQDCFDMDSTAPSITDESAGLPAIERQVLLKEIDATLRANVTGPHAERDRKIFWLHYRHGMSARAIASLPSISLTAKGAESTLLRLTRLVRAKMSTGEEKEPDAGKGLRSAESL
jgi:RNA polymerase sigma-70 factor (ECF subfamily)